MLVRDVAKGELVIRFLGYLTIDTSIKKQNVKFREAAVVASKEDIRHRGLTRLERFGEINAKRCDIDARCTPSPLARPAGLVYIECRWGTAVKWRGVVEVN
jgi:hypothetical protein